MSTAGMATEAGALIDPLARARTRKQGRSKVLEYTCSVALLGVMIAFTVRGVNLALGNRSVGSPDSQNNLDTARNLLRGAGFTTHIVQQLFVAQTWPNPETIRPPGVPFVLAAAFRLFGVTLTIPVILNVFAALFSAGFLRAALSHVAPRARWFADCAAMLMLLSPVFELLSIWNNGFLVLTTSALLFVASKALTDGSSPRLLLISGALVCAFGVLMKPSFLVTAVPFGVFLALCISSGGSRVALGRMGMFFGVFALVTAPYWVRNLYLFHDPLHSPWRAVRLGVRYGGLPAGPWWSVRFDRPVRYAEVIDANGVSGLAQRELKCQWVALKALMRINEPVFVLGAGGLLLTFGRGTRARHAAGLIAFAEPWFTDGLYWSHEVRYLWPAFPCMLYMAGVAIGDFTLQSAFAPYARGMRRFVTTATFAALYIGASTSTDAWAGWVSGAKASAPGWVKAVSKLPKDAVIMTDDPWLLAWYGARRSVICPGGSREDFERAFTVYHPAYWLETQRGCGPRPAPIRSSDYRNIASGSGWQLDEFTIDSKPEQTEPR